MAMTKTYIDKLMESLDKDMDDVDWEYFVDHFPNDIDEFSQALDDLVSYEALSFTESLRMTYIAVKEIEQLIEFTESMKDNTIALSIVAQDTIINLISTQKRIIGQWVNIVVAHNNMDKLLKDIEDSDNIRK